MSLYARDAQGRFVVGELKRSRAPQKAVFPSARYVGSVQRVVGTGQVRGILAAPSITGPARKEVERHGLKFAEPTGLPPPEHGDTQTSLF